jgi:hypothetical protein
VCGGLLPTKTPRFVSRRRRGGGVSLPHTSIGTWRTDTRVSQTIKTQPLSKAIVSALKYRSQLSGPLGKGDLHADDYCVYVGK